jgi:glycerol-3-phosphate dehydrogenase
VDPEDVEYLLTQASRAIPGGGWEEGSILGCFAGVRALDGTPGKPAESVSREWILESVMPGLLVSTGGKFTSARADAASIVERATAELGIKGEWTDPSRDRLLPWCPLGLGWEEWLRQTGEEGRRAGLDAKAAAQVARRYGSRSPEVFQTAKADGLAGRIVPDLPFVWADVAHAAASEGAVTLGDLLRRRVPLLVLARCDRGILTEAARLAGRALGWSDERCDREVSDVCPGRRGP